MSHTFVGLRRIENPDPSDLGSDVVEFLRRLGGPTLIWVSGKDSSRRRGIITLQHGNEPSGVKAVFHWLKSGIQPEVDVICIIASIDAALTPPLFTHRFLTAHRDLNRCYNPPYQDETGKLALSILEALLSAELEALVDIHNTSGSSPTFVVCTQDSPQNDALCSLFSRRMILTDLRLGALMEHCNDRMPCIAIECGGAQDAEADAIAIEGLLRYVQQANIVSHVKPEVLLNKHRNPVRIEVQPNVAIAYAPEAVADVDLTLRADLENHNFGCVDPSVSLGWVSTTGLGALSAVNHLGEDVLQSLFKVKYGQLYPAKRLRLFMVTVEAEIAYKDCLFYAIEEAEQLLMNKK